jgi:hypothetical protein
MEHWWRILAGENTCTRRKTSPSSTLTTRNLTWTDLGSTPVLRGERPAADCLSHGTSNLKLTVILRNNKDLIRTSQKTNCICVKDHFVLIYIFIKREGMEYLQVDGQITNFESDGLVGASACSASCVSTEEMPDDLLTLTGFVHILGHSEVPE